MCHPINGQLTSLYHELPEQVHGVRLFETAVEQEQEPQQEESERTEDQENEMLETNRGHRSEPMWLLSGQS